MKLTLSVLIATCFLAAAGVTYTYDAAGHLTAANYGNGSAITYTYDPAGHMISRSLPGPVITSVTTAYAGPIIAENTFIVIKGANLVPGTTPANGAIWSTAPSFVSGVMPTQLGGVSVTVNNKPAFVYFYCSAATDPACAQDQLNILTPLDNTIGSVPVVVTSGTVSTPPFTVNMQAVAPSFLLFSAAGYVAATHADNSLIGPSSLYSGLSTPATPGETIILWAVGFGLPVTPPVNGLSSQTGSLPVLPACQVGGYAAVLSFAGLNGSPGLYQLNLVIPATVANGDNAIGCTYNGSTTPTGDLITVQSQGEPPSWTHFTLSDNPAVSSGSVVYDSSTNEVIFFGGDTPGCCLESNQTWFLANADGGSGPPSWGQVFPLGTPPAGRSGHSSVYDQQNNRMIMFGGGQRNSYAYGVLFNDAWVLENANGAGGTPTWIQLAPLGTPPTPREGQGMVYDPNSNRIIIFGGGNNGIMDVPNDVWVLTNANGLGGTPEWIQIVAATSNAPAARQSFAFGYDPATNRMVVFGGCCYEMSDSWVLENANGLGGTPTWTQISQGALTPGARSDFWFGYNASTDRLFFSCGLNYTRNYVTDSWVLTNANGVAPPIWVNTIPNAFAVAPAQGSFLSGTYDPIHNQLLALPNTSDLWVLHNADSTTLVH